MVDALTGLSVREVSVQFGGLAALSRVSFEVLPGEVHGLIGPNGAGKTTLLNVVSRFLKPTEGRVEWNRRSLDVPLRELARVGISRTFQTPAMFDSLTAEENVILGAYSRTSAGVLRSMFRTRGVRREEDVALGCARSRLEQMGFSGDPRRSMAELTLAEKRTVELARALMVDPALLLLDEPTAGLDSRETESYAALIRRLSDEGCAVVVVEHNVPFVFQLCSRVTALHDGRVLASGEAQRVRSDAAVIASYIGAQGETAVNAAARPAMPNATDRRRSPDRPTGDAYADGLRITGLQAGYGQTEVLRELSLDLQPGQLGAVFGRNGAGKSTMLGAVMGQPRPTGGSVTWRGVECAGRRTSTLVRAGITLVPQHGGVIRDQSVNDNLLLSLFGARLSRRNINERRAEMYERFPRIAERRHQLAGSLSGGERQMLAIANALIRHPSLILLDEPSIGLAPKAVEDLQKTVHDLAETGLTILLAEQNVGWVVPIATRAYLLDAGRIVREGPVQELAASEVLADQYLGSSGQEARV